MADQVVIVGAGLTGLVTAYQLHRRGVPSVVLEADDRPGGRVATVRFADGAVAEGGMEEFWESSPAYPLLQELGLPLMDQPALSSVMLRGCFHPFRGGSAGAYFDELGGLPGIDRWTDLAGSVLDQLAVDQRTGCWSDHLVALQRMAFPAFVARDALPRCLEEWIRVVVESETAVEWEHLGALDGIAEMSLSLIHI